MKVRITRLYFDGLRRHREGSVITISDKKYMNAKDIPKTSRKKVGDYIYFASSCMEIVDAKTPVKDVPRPKPGLTVTDKKEPETTPESSEEVPAAGGDDVPAEEVVI